jgi:hypothetical protein
MITVNTLFEQKEQNEHVTIPDFQLYNIVTKTGWYWLKNRHKKSVK